MIRRGCLAKILAGRIFFAFVPLFLASFKAAVSAVEPRDYAVDLECDPQIAPPALIFSWPQRDIARQYLVRRRTSPEAGWGEPIAVLPGNSSGFTDSSITLGIAFEYEVQMQLTTIGYEGDFINAYTYVSAGVEIPAVDHNGKALVLVDASLASGLADSLAAFQQDLIGAGWQVVILLVDRSAPVPAVKEIIRAEYLAAPANLRSVILVGHIPVPYSGNIAPDFHESHRGAWPADVYYGGFEGEWTDAAVSVRSEDSPANDNFPGDGKFDQSDIPASVLLEIGRVDFANLPSFKPRTELDLLKTYFQKDHGFRHGLVTVPRRGILHDNFGDVAGDAPAVDAWRHFPVFFGHDHMVEVGSNALLPILNDEGYLWAYGCGGGSFTKADGVGNTSDFAALAPKTVFWILHGSYFGDWNSEDNFLRAAIATPGSSLASIWSGLPHWYLHHMALGSTVGYSTRVTQNNRGAYKSYRNFSPAQVHIALLGDPTLGMFPALPPVNLTAVSSGAAVHLNWGASADESVAGYKVYHANSPLGPFEALTREAISDTAFTHSATRGRHYYMVRALKRERSGSGSFYVLSQGVFASAELASTYEFVNSIAVEADGGIVLSLRGLPTHPFRVLESLDGTEWHVAGEGLSDPNGFAQYRDNQNGARLKLFRVYWP